MKAVRFSVSVPRFILARTLGRYSNSAVFGRLSGLAIAEVPSPTLPGPDWVRVKVRMCGICGTDVGNLTFNSSPILEPFGSFPAVLGHEILGDIVEVGPAVRGLEVGQRAVVEPMLSCTARGYPQGDSCSSCSEGLPSTCERGGEESPVKVDGRALSRGMMIGYHRDLPGGWGEEMVVHQSHVFAVPDQLDDRTAVLVEPLSISVHAVLRSGILESDARSVLVIGSGTIALATVWALRALGFEGVIASQTKREHEARLAQKFGADVVFKPGSEAREALIGTGASAYMPIVGAEVYAGGGYPFIFDCVGNAGSLDQSMRSARPRGTVVMLGCAAEIPKLDLTLIWARELKFRGFVGYGEDRHNGVDEHTFGITLRLLEETSAPVSDMVTHVFPLKQYPRALSAAANHRRSGAIKVLLKP